MVKNLNVIRKKKNIQKATFICKGSAQISFSSDVECVIFDNLEYRSFKKILICSGSENIEFSVLYRKKINSKINDLNNNSLFEHYSSNLIACNRFSSSLVRVSSYKHHQDGISYFNSFTDRAIIIGEWGSISPYVALNLMNYLLINHSSVLFVDFNPFYSTLFTGGYIGFAVLDTPIFTKNSDSFMISEDLTIWKKYVGASFSNSYEITQAVTEEACKAIKKVLANNRFPVVFSGCWERNFLCCKLNDRLVDEFTDFFVIKVSCSNLVSFKNTNSKQNDFFIPAQNLNATSRPIKSKEGLISQVFFQSNFGKDVRIRKENLTFLISTVKEEQRIDSLSMQKLIFLGRVVEYKVNYEEKDLKIFAILTRMEEDEVELRLATNARVYPELKDVTITLFLSMEQQIPKKLTAISSAELIPYSGLRLRGFGSKRPRRIKTDKK